MRNRTLSPIEAGWEDGGLMANDNDSRKGRWQGFDLGGGGRSGEPRRMRTSPWLWILVFLGVLILFNYVAAPRTSQIDYSEFLEHVERGEIIGTLEISATSVSGRYEGSTGEVDFATTIPP